MFQDGNCTTNQIDIPTKDQRIHLMFAKDWEHHLVILVMVDFTSSFCIPDCILHWLHSKPAQLTVAAKSEVTPLRNLYGFSHRLIDQTCAVDFFICGGMDFPWDFPYIQHVLFECI